MKRKIVQSIMSFLTVICMIPTPVYAAENYVVDESVEEKIYWEDGEEYSSPLSKYIQIGEETMGYPMNRMETHWVNNETGENYLTLSSYKTSDGRTFTPKPYIEESLSYLLKNGSRDGIYAGMVLEFGKDQFEMEYGYVTDQTFFENEDFGEQYVAVYRYCVGTELEPDDYIFCFSIAPCETDDEYFINQESGYIANSSDYWHTIDGCTRVPVWTSETLSGDTTVQEGMNWIHWEGTSCWGKTYTADFPVIGYPRQWGETDDTVKKEYTVEPSESFPDKDTEKPENPHKVEVDTEITKSDVIVTEYVVNKETDELIPSRVLEQEEYILVNPIVTKETTALDVDIIDPKTEKVIGKGAIPINPYKRVSRSLIFIFPIVGSGVVFFIWFKRKKIRFHGVFSESIVSGVKEIGKKDTAVMENWFIPSLITKLNNKEITIQDYIVTLNECGVQSLLPADTMMTITTEDENGQISYLCSSMKADEKKLFIILDELDGKANSPVTLRLKDEKSNLDIELKFNI